MNDISLSPMDRVRPKQGIAVSTFVKLGLAIVVAAALIATVVRNVYSDTAEVDRKHVLVSEVRKRAFGDYIPITGKLVPIDTVYLDAVEGGQVVKRHVDEGALVKAGDLLVTLKNTNLQLEIIGREAQVTEQLNNLMMTELSLEQNRLRHRKDLIELEQKIESIADRLERSRAVAAAGAISEDAMKALERDYKYTKALRDATAEAQEVDLASQQNQIAKIEAAIRSMNENLQIARDNLKSLQVTAPISGQLTMLKANSGESLAKGQRFGQIDEVDAFKIAAPVDEFYLSRLVVGQQGEVDIEGKRHAVVVKKIYPEVQERQFRTDLYFLEKPAGLRLGQTLTGRLDLGMSEPAMTIEYGPFYEATGGEWVFVLDSSGEEAVRRPVKLGRYNKNGVEVISGLTEGEHVIVSDYRPFIDSDQLRIISRGGARL